MWTQTLIRSSCVLAASFAAMAAPLDKSRIASDAKWIVHIDAEGLRKSGLGDYVMNDLVKPALEEADELKNANLTMNPSNIVSITAYGPAFDKGPEGVLMISTTANPRKDLDTVAGMFLASAGTNSPFNLIEQEPYPLYSFGKTVFLAPTEHTLFVAKSKEQIDRAFRVSLGKEESLANNGGFQNFREPPNSFFFAAIADGFMGNAAIPAQAEILKQATGGRLYLGEREKNLFVNLVFQGKDDMATTKIQQVLQGIMAIISLSQNDPEITQLANATKIASEGRNVQVSLEYPSDKTVEKIKEASSEKPKEHRAKSKNKNKKNKSKKNPAPEEKPASTVDEQPPSAEIEEKPKAEK